MSNNKIEIQNNSHNDEQGDTEDKRWDRFSNWIHCICIVTFDLELGQTLESIYPRHISLSKQEISNICYLAFPDSNSGCMGDTNFIIRLQNNPGNCELRTEHKAYNSKCPTALQVNSVCYWGYVYFRQVKDITLPRGYFQKSVVILSRLPFNNLFSNIVSLIAPEYFDNDVLSLEASCYNIDQWPVPVPGVTLNLPLLGSVFQTYIPHQAHASSLIIQLATLNDMSTTIENQIQTSVEDLNLFEILQPVLSHIDMLWELVITTEPWIVMATSPTYCSAMVLALTRMISPLKYCADHRPYFTVRDSEFKQFTSKDQGPPPPVILGVTNAFFAKMLHHWPHTIRLREDCASTNILTDMTRSYAAGFIFTTSLPPTVLAGSLKSIEILSSSEGMALRKRHQDNVKYLRNTLLRYGFPVEHTPSHIIPVKIGNPLQCSTISDRLLREKGHYVQAINYPTVARGQEKLRLAPTPYHTKELMDLLVQDILEIWTDMKLPLNGLQCTKECQFCRQPILLITLNQEVEQTVQESSFVLYLIARNKFALFSEENS